MFSQNRNIQDNYLKLTLKFLSTMIIMEASISKKSRTLITVFCGKGIRTHTKEEVQMNARQNK